MNMQGRCKDNTQGRSTSKESWENGESDRIGEKSRQAGEHIDWVQKVLGLCEAENGTTNVKNCWRAEQVGKKECGKMLKRIHILEVGRVPAKGSKDWKIEGKKRWITRKEYKRLIH